MKYFAKIRYVGTDFHGFQVQPGHRTVQGELCRVLTMALGVPVAVTGCSRTDAGVHAEAFCLTADAPGATVPPEKLPVAVLPYLPSDLSLYEAVLCPDGFHPRYDVSSKEYVYRILNRKIPDPFLAGRVWTLPRTVTDDGFRRMCRAAADFVGTHDFSSFMAEGSDVSDTVRTVFDASVTREGDMISFFVRADGFLYHMVRIMTGTLTDIAFGRLSEDAVAGILESKNRSAAGMTAPPDGLYLHRVVYDWKN